MKNFFRRIKAFTLAELAIVFMILALIAAVTYKVTQQRSDYYLNRFMYYSAFTNLQKGIEELVAVGCTDAPTPTDDMSKGYCKITKYSLPIYGHNTDDSRALCDRLAEEEFNTIGSVTCSQVGNLSDSTDFATATPNFTTTNGMKFFNLGSSPADTSDANIKLFTVYVDIDGKKRNSKLNEDIMKFNIYTNGVVLPDYDSIGANDPNYLSTAIKYWDSTTSKYAWLLTSIPYREAICKANLRPAISSPSYCTAAPPSYPSKTYATADPKCPDSGNTCSVVVSQPGFIFGK